MILTDYYSLTKQSNQKSKLRIDVEASTLEYPHFEGLRNKKGELFFYLGDNYTQAGRLCKSSLALSKGVHITSLYQPDIKVPLYYGDIANTTDAILVKASDFSICNGRVQDGSKLEIYVARGQRANRQSLFNLFVDGELDSEVKQLKAHASKE